MITNRRSLGPGRRRLHDDETFEVGLSNAVNAEIDDGVGIGTIRHGNRSQAGTGRRPGERLVRERASSLTR